MLYFDNSATTLPKPETVAQAMNQALRLDGNAGRSFHGPAMRANRAILEARQEIARLVGMDDARNVAFTSGATESFNLIVHSLVPVESHVITTRLEHNAVLRPLYQRGCSLSFLDCDEQGRLLLQALPSLLRPQTRCIICTHASNVLGSVAPVEELYAFCQQKGLLLILDTAQTMGSYPFRHTIADILCFTGHKGLMGPQGTGGVVARNGIPFQVVKTGGSGTDSFAAHQPLSMPDVLEAGTPNGPGISGLRAGVAFVMDEGVERIQQKEKMLCELFLQGIAGIPAVKGYGPSAGTDRLPVVSLNIGDLSSEDAALQLWERWGIATRPGIHCAPLVHQRFGTEKRGMVRFSFGYFNTEDEIEQAVQALRLLAGA